MNDLRYDGLTADQIELGAIAHDYLGKHVDDPAGGAELGWFGIGIPESAGGAGGDLADLAPIIEAAGVVCARTAVPWTTGVVAQLLVGYRNEAGELLEALAGGAAMALLPVGDPIATTTRLRTTPGGPAGSLIMHGHPRPAVVVVPCASDAGPEVVVVPAEHLDLEPVASVDPSRHLFRVDLPGEQLPGSIRLRGDDVLDRLRLLVGQVAALDAAGAAREALGRVLSYARERHQFGRPIGSFQAYKHRCATNFQLLKLAQVGAFRAVAEADPILAHAAAVQGIPSCTRICGDAVQLHGAIGFSWETGLHAVLKRSRSAEIFAGAGTPRMDSLLSAVSA